MSRLVLLLLLVLFGCVSIGGMLYVFARFARDIDDLERRSSGTERDEAAADLEIPAPSLPTEKPATQSEPHVAGV